MTLPDLLKDYAIYNHWANSQIVEWLKKYPAEMLEREVASSFPSLKQTLLHIWSAEDVWLGRLQGIEPPWYLPTDFDGGIDELFIGHISRSAEFMAFLGAQDDAYFSQKTAYVHRTGKAYNQLNSEIILHCLQHSTYHRGQIVTMARGLGITEVPQTDYILYARNKS